MKFRTILFWLHLIAGVTAGLIILVMCLTGAAVAFEKELIAWAERDVRRVTVPSPPAQRVPLDTLLDRTRELFPGTQPTGITLDADPTVAVLISVGRTNSFHANPYTGQINAQGAAGTRAFMRVMIDWHRWVGRQGDTRPVGKAITGACTAAFLFLGVSGLILWLPSKWSRNVVRAAALFNFKLRAKARDWNWHNVIGLWCGPVLIVLSATALPISYQWATKLIYTLTRSTPPPPATGPGALPPIVVPQPPVGTMPASLETLVSKVQERQPAWRQITIRLPSGSSRNETRRAPQPVSVSLKARDGSPRFAVAQLSLDPFSGAVLRQEPYGEFNLGRKVRSWTRYLHTGEALGPIGQTVAGLSSLGGSVLVWTGLALAWRRFRARGGRGTPGGNQAAATSTSPAVAPDRPRKAGTGRWS